MVLIREAAVANTFYPGDANNLQHVVNALLLSSEKNLPAPKALIAPHAGYRYSGQIAANAYACLEQVRHDIKRVVILGPAHQYPFSGIAVPSYDYFETPLGKVKVDQKTIGELTDLPQIKVLDYPHIEEHSIEVQLPFLQMILKDFSIIPLLIGDTTVAQVAEVIEKLWGGPETLIVISSDLSHYLEYNAAQAIDQETADAILSCDYRKIGFDQACGRTAINALLMVAPKKGLKAYQVDLRNSGDTTDLEETVVGYGAFHFR